MTAKAKTLPVRMEDPKARAKPALAYGGCSLSVDIDMDEKERPQRLRVSVDLELPEATRKNRLNQDLLAACRTVGEAAKYLKDRETFFKEQIRIRMETKKCKEEPGFLSGQLTPQNSKDFSWKDFAIAQLTKVVRQKEGCSKKRAEVLAIAQAQAAYDKAPVKKKDAKGNLIKKKVSVKGVILDS